MNKSKKNDLINECIQSAYEINNVIRELKKIEWTNEQIERLSKIGCLIGNLKKLKQKDYDGGAA